MPGERPGPSRGLESEPSERLAARCCNLEAGLSIKPAAAAGAAAAATQLSCRAAAGTGGAGPAGTLLTATLARRIPVATPARRQTALHGGGQQSGAAHPRRRNLEHQEGI